MRRAIVVSILALASLQLFATTALAGPDWCDDGSPPPNDFRFQQTGARSDRSPKEWLRSTTGGQLSFTTTTYTGTLTGGVATGMEMAKEHATKKTDH